MVGKRLHVGCGTVHLDGWLNADLFVTPATDLTFDLRQSWPLQDNSIRVLYASHVLEHLPSPQHFFQEAWRVLEPVGSGMVLRVPYGGNTAAWADWTHLRPWYPASFAGLQPGYGDAVCNPQSQDWSAFFGLATLQVRLSARLLPWRKLPGMRRVLRRWIDWVPEALEEIFVQAFPLKHPADIAQYRATHGPNTIPLEYVFFRHQITGDVLPTEILVPL